jgi:signal transduction histidine kinase/CheY-like chemotaxis protein
MKNQKSSMPGKIMFVFIVSAALIIVFGTVYYFVEKSISESDVKNQLASIGKLKTEEIQRWRIERIGDAHVISQNSDFKKTYKEFLDRINYERNRENLNARIDALDYYQQYENMLLLGFDNTVKYSSKDQGQTLGINTLNVISTAKSKNEITMSDFYRNERNNNIYIDIVAPLFFNSEYLGCLLLVVNPDKYLYSMIQNWPYQTETGENLLYKVEKNEVVYLNEIRFAKNTALKFKVPITQSNENILSVQGANGKLGISSGKDYLKNDVLGFISKIENTNWILVTKINSSEAFAKANQKSFYTILLLIFIVIIISGAFYMFWRDNMRQNLKILRQNEWKDWLKTGLVRLNDVMRGDISINDFASNVISELSEYMDAKIGAFYVNRSIGINNEYILYGSYAYTKGINISTVFKEGEGLVGQAALERKQLIINNLPDDYIKIKSGLGETLPKYICLMPVIFEGDVTGVLEFGFLTEMNDIQSQYLSDAVRLISLSMATVFARENLNNELERSQELAEELQRQQEELKASNEELEEQTQLLKQSEEKLKSQQEELQVSNEELEARNDSLEIQKRAIETARLDIKIKAEELALASKYKSEFLANMSHELRTPLNSLLILSKMLHDNKEGNLNEEQTESAGIIYNSGNDLLHLINEILDLSKIEAGRMDVHNETVHLSELVEHIRNNFKHMSEEKGLELKIGVANDVPESITSDRKRIEQILKNLISNSIKFTKKGEVKIFFHKPSEDIKFKNSDLNVNECLGVEVIDTGIGISEHKQKIIFEAFQQEEGGTSREFGGTGLGLSISKELAALLGGEIHLKSVKDKGSTFTLYLPFINKEVNTDSDVKTPIMSKDNVNDIHKSLEIKDDRNVIVSKDKLILIIEDNVNFANLMLQECHRKNFKGIIALTGEDGLQMAEKFRPTAIILDIKLPGIDGFTVLDILKENSKLRHIPVHIIAAEDSTLDAMKKGAIGFLIKPPRKEELDEAFKKIIDYTNNKLKNLLIAEDDDVLRNSIVKLIGNGDVQTKAVSSGKEVMEELINNDYDCMIMDLGLADISGFELLKNLESEKINIPPIIVYTGRDLTRDEESLLRNYADSIIIKGVRSEERLLDEASLFLHRVVEKMPSQKRKMIVDLYETDEMFKDKQILLVDDDMRNMFALSKVLSQRGFKLLKAENGKKALEILKTESDVNLILMDIMMPEMDGYETMKRIRAQEKFFNTPIIALTAKAMKKDYEKCISAGANDYLPKPVDIDRLFSMLRVWLYR